MPSPRFNDDPAGTLGHFTTQDITTAAVLATLGFAFRGALPICHVVSAHRLQAWVDKQTGRLCDVNRLSYNFDFAAKHPTLGMIMAPSVEAAVERQRIASDQSAGRPIDPQRRAKAAEALTDNATTAALADLVAHIADGIENILLLAEATEEAGLAPLIQTSRALRRGRLDVLQPLETEPAVQRALRDHYRNG